MVNARSKRPSGAKSRPVGRPSKKKSTTVTEDVGTNTKPRPQPIPSYRGAVPAGTAPTKRQTRMAPTHDRADSIPTEELAAKILLSFGKKTGALRTVNEEGQRGMNNIDVGEDEDTYSNGNSQLDDFGEHSRSLSSRLLTYIVHNR
jgi:hypothetical protein